MKFVIALLILSNVSAAFACKGLDGEYACKTTSKYTYNPYPTLTVSSGKNEYGLKTMSIKLDNYDVHENLIVDGKTRPTEDMKRKASCTDSSLNVTMKYGWQSSSSWIVKTKKGVDAYLDGYKYKCVRIQD